MNGLEFKNEEREGEGPRGYPPSLWRALARREPRPPENPSRRYPLINIALLERKPTADPILLLTDKFRHCYAQH
jgi:hypothetical protein